MALPVLAFLVMGQTPSAEWDKAAVAALKDVHDRGAELYNSGDAAGAYRLYQGALLAVRPLLDHRPFAQKAIDDGFAEANKSAGSVRVQAFRLHETIEQVRATLKLRPAEAALTMRGKEVAPAPRLRRPGPTDGPAVRGRVTLDGKPLVGHEIVFLRADRTDITVYGTTTFDDGTYLVGRGVPPGDYEVEFPAKAGGPVPPKYNRVATSGLTAKVVAGENSFNFALKSK